MPRPKRADEPGAIYHAVNRGNARSTIFHNTPKLLSHWPIAWLPSWVAREDKPLSEQELDVVLFQYSVGNRNVAVLRKNTHVSPP